MTVEEARFELSRLTVRQEQLESEILAILNKGCLPLEDAKRKIDELEASGVETETVNGVKCLVEKRTYDGQERRFTILPIWYPRYAAMNDVFESLEMDKTVVKAIKKSQEEKKRMGIENAAGGGYVAAQEKVFEKVEEYTANKAKIEELDKALKVGQSPGYIEHLIEKGYLYTDGKRVINSLNDTVCALVDYLNPEKASETDNSFPPKVVYITHVFVRQTFLQENEKPYSEIACRDAVNLAYVNFGRKPRGLHRSPREPNQSLKRR